MPGKNLNIDLTNATEDDLINIKNEVLRTIADRVKGSKLGEAMTYDRHGSGHSRSSAQGLEKVEILKNPVIKQP